MIIYAGFYLVGVICACLLDTCCVLCSQDWNYLFYIQMIAVFISATVSTWTCPHWASMLSVSAITSSDEFILNHDPWKLSRHMLAIHQNLPSVTAPSIYYIIKRDGVVYECGYWIQNYSSEKVENWGGGQCWLRQTWASLGTRLPGDIRPESWMQGHFNVKEALSFMQSDQQP